MKHFEGSKTKPELNYWQRPSTQNKLTLSHFKQLSYADYPYTYAIAASRAVKIIY